MLDWVLSVWAKATRQPDWAPTAKIAQNQFLWELDEFVREPRTVRGHLSREAAWYATKSPWYPFYRWQTAPWLVEASGMVTQQGWAHWMKRQKGRWVWVYLCDKLGLREKTEIPTPERRVLTERVWAVKEEADGEFGWIQIAPTCQFEPPTKCDVWYPRH